jgi:hypothetical protein
VVADDHVVVLSPDRSAMQARIAAARREESTWPRVSYLWALHPVVDWCCDKAEGQFGRMTAPVLTLLGGLSADEAVVLVSGLLPNRRAQPLLHQWYAARFRKEKLQEVEPFASWAARLDLPGRRLTNRNVPAHLDALRALLTPAIDAVQSQVMTRWKAREQVLNAKLDDELTRLEDLKNRQLGQLGFDWEAATLSDAQQRDRRRVETLFQPFFRFVEDSMTAGERPFLEVLAVFRAETGYVSGGGKS